jgi:Carboxypeptidase regulatory-like domain
MKWNYASRERLPLVLQLAPEIGGGGFSSDRRRVAGASGFASLPALFAVVVTVLSVHETVAQTPPRDTSQQRGGSAVIRGRVLAADTGLPLQRAVITCGSSSLGVSRTVWTDAQGRYEISGLPAGRVLLLIASGHLLPAGV